MADKVTGDNIYKTLIYIDEFYDKMNESERREFMTVLVDNVQIYEERQANGQWLKSMEFKLPNRSMHISGMFEIEVDIENVKVDIQNKLMSAPTTISEKTINHAIDIFARCGKGKYRFK